MTGAAAPLQVSAAPALHGHKVPHARDHDAPVPLAPSLLRVSLTSGMVGSSMPLMNSMLLAMQVTCGRAARTATARVAGRARVNAEAALGAAGPKGGGADVHGVWIPAS